MSAPLLNLIENTTYISTCIYLIVCEKGGICDHSFLYCFYRLSCFMVTFICMNRRVNTSTVFKQAKFYEACEQLVRALRFPSR